VERHFEQDLRHLETRFLEMGDLVCNAIHSCIHGLQQLDEAAAMNVVDLIEPQVNSHHREIDGLGMELLTLQHPVATDLRLVTAIMKSNKDLERMGDRAVNIALRIVSILSRPPLRPLMDMSKMGAAVEAMAHDTLDAFKRRDHRLAIEVLRRDREVDRYRDTAFQDLLVQMKADSEMIDLGVDLILTARNFERIADHATNIAESVVFLVLGKDVGQLAEGLR
jgi:phosphate transport system protein